MNIYKVRTKILKRIQSSLIFLLATVTDDEMLFLMTEKYRLLFINVNIIINNMPLETSIVC
jgi:hypothetical protein